MPQVSKQIEPANWNPLLRAIHEGTCVPFLGAAANIGGGGFKIPTGVELARDLVRFITNLQADSNPEDLVRLDPPLDAYKEMLRSGVTDLARVSLHLRDQLGPRDFLDEIRARLIADNCQPSPLLKVVASLPFELIVTTNYDCMMEQALEDEGRAFYPVAQPLRGFDETEGVRINTELENFDGVRLYKIHGEFTRQQEAAEAVAQNAGEDSPIIITEEDYIQFLTVLREPVKGVPKWIDGKIRRSRFLFLGYGLEDWDFRTMYEGLIASIPKYMKPTSYAIQFQPSPFWVNYWANRGVRIYDMDIKDFAQQLKDKYAAFVQQLGARQAAPGEPPQAPQGEQ